MPGIYYVYVICVYVYVIHVNASSPIPAVLYQASFRFDHFQENAIIQMPCLLYISVRYCTNKPGAIESVGDTLMVVYYSTETQGSSDRFSAKWRAVTTGEYTK